MIITRTPFRISFFGGGTDYPKYYRKYGGVVLDGIDPLKIANAFGMDGESIDDEDKVQEAVERGLKIVTEENRPYLLEFKLPIGLPEGGIADKQYRMR